MVVRLSQKLAAKIGMKPSRVLPLDANPFADWSGHLFSADRTQYVILTNTASLYSAILYGRGITDDSRFLERGLGAIREVMDDDGLEFIYGPFGHRPPVSRTYAFDGTSPALRKLISPLGLTLGGTPVSKSPRQTNGCRTQSSRQSVGVANGDFWRAVQAPQRPHGSVQADIEILAEIGCDATGNTDDVALNQLAEVSLIPAICTR